MKDFMDFEDQSEIMWFVCLIAEQYKRNVNNFEIKDVLEKDRAVNWNNL